MKAPSPASLPADTSPNASFTSPQGGAQAIVPLAVRHQAMVDVFDSPEYAAFCEGIHTNNMQSVKTSLRAFSLEQTAKVLRGPCPPERCEALRQQLVQKGVALPNVQSDIEADAPEEEFPPATLPACIAAAAGNVEMIKVLLRNARPPVNLNAGTTRPSTDFDGPNMAGANFAFTPAFYAAYFERTDVLDLLQERSCKMMPALVALQYRAPKATVQWLAKAGQRDEAFAMALRRATDDQRLEAIRTLVQEGDINLTRLCVAQDDAVSNTQLKYAIEQGKYKAARLLVELGAPQYEPVSSVDDDVAIEATPDASLLLLAIDSIQADSAYTADGIDLVTAFVQAAKNGAASRVKINNYVVRPDVNELEHALDSQAPAALYAALYCAGVTTYSKESLSYLQEKAAALQNGELYSLITAQAQLLQAQTAQTPADILAELRSACDDYAQMCRDGQTLQWEYIEETIAGDMDDGDLKKMRKPDGKFVKMMKNVHIGQTFNRANPFGSKALALVKRKPKKKPTPANA